MEKNQWATMEKWAKIIHVKPKEMLEHLKEIGYVLPKVKSLKKIREDEISQEGQKHCMIASDKKSDFLLWDFDTFACIVKECVKIRELIYKCPRCRKLLDDDKLYSPDFERIECDHCGYHGNRYIQYLQYKK